MQTRFFDHLNLTTLTRISVILAAFFIPISTTLTDLFFVLIFLLTFIAGDWKEKYKQLYQNPITLCFFLIFFLYTIGVFYSASSLNIAFKYYLKYTPFLFVVFIPTFYKEEKWQTYAIYAFMIAVFIVISLSFAQYLYAILFHSIKKIYFTRLGSLTLTTVFKDRLGQSFVVTIASLFALIYAFNKIKNRWVYLVYAILGIANILIISACRTAYFILFAALFYLAIQKFRLKGIIVFTIISCLLIGSSLLISPIFKASTKFMIYDIQKIFRGNLKTDTGIRIIQTKNGISLVRKRPLLGYGTGGIQTAYTHLVSTAHKYNQITRSIANEYANISIQLGLIGLFMLLTLLIIQWFTAYKLLFHTKLATHIIVICIAVGSLANSWLTDTTPLHFYTLFSAILIGNYRIARTKTKASAASQNT